MSATLKRALDVPHHHDRPTFPYSPADHGRDDDFICAKCKAALWSTMPYKTIRSLNATFAELVTSRCRICRMLAHIKPASLDGLSCEVKSIPPGHILPEINSDDIALSFALLAVGPGTKFNLHYEHPTIAILESKEKQISNFGPRVLQPHIVDYDLIKASIQHCDCYHQKRCTGLAATITVSGGLRVIDLRTRTLIEAPSHCKYAALSYVWGSQTGGITLDADLGSPPRVIEDAFSVCVSLGLEFLWVDRYVS